MSDTGGLRSLLAILDLEKIEENLFRGQSPDATRQRVFGGQVIGQALVAAARTVEGRPCHSLHGYFLRPGDPRIPILYEVDRIRDGRSFTTRRVVAVQNGRAIFNMSVSFQEAAEGVEHQLPMPPAPAPQPQSPPASPGNDNPMLASLAIEQHELAPIDWRAPTTREPTQQLWFRARDSSGEGAVAIGDDLIVHQCLLAYASDWSLIDTALLPHALTYMDSRLQIASLDHAIWFHRPFRFDEWLFYTQDSPVTAGTRGFSRGSIFTRDGLLVASVAQEGLIRVRPGT